MSFFKKLKDGVDTDFSDRESFYEETYQKIYKKIGRDFIHKEDFKYIIRELLEALDKTYLIDEVPLDRNISSLLKLKQYEDNLNKPINLRKKFKDLDEIDWIYGEDNEQ